jgi:uncharacterized membrane protein (UPF0127 family)
MSIKTIQVKVLHSYKEKSIGLIGAKKISPVYFTTRWGIHTFGVSSAIDVIILNDTFHVVKIAHHLKPYKIFVWNPKYKHVIELPVGDIPKRNISLGDQITLMASQ